MARDALEEEVWNEEEKEKELQVHKEPLPTGSGIMMSRAGHDPES